MQSLDFVETLNFREGNDILYHLQGQLASGFKPCSHEGNDVKIGGIKNQTDEKYLIRFLHEDEEDGDIRVTIVGKNEAGFSFSFAKDAESTIEPQFKAHPMDKEGTLLIFDEEIPQTA